MLEHISGPCWTLRPGITTLAPRSSLGCTFSGALSRVEYSQCFLMLMVAAELPLGFPHFCCHPG
jgi:hypothetical protein